MLCSIVTTLLKGTPRALPETRPSLVAAGEREVDGTLLIVGADLHVGTAPTESRQVRRRHSAPRRGRRQPRAGARLRRSVIDQQFARAACFARTRRAAFEQRGDDRAKHSELHSAALEAANRSRDARFLSKRVRVEALGRKGRLAEISKSIGKLALEEPRAPGKLLNAAKQELEAKIDARLAALDNAALDARLENEWIDLTVPAPVLARAACIR